MITNEKAKNHHNIGSYPHMEHGSPFYSVPRIKELYEPIMHIMCERLEAHTYEIREALASYFYMTEEDCEYKENERYTVFQARVNAACYRLARCGLLENSNRGKYKITSIGIEALDKRYYIDFTYIKQLNELDLDSSSDSSELPRPHNQGEFYEVKQVTLDDIFEMRKANTQILNKMKFRNLVLSNGKIVEVIDSIDRIYCSSEDSFIDNAKQSVAEGTIQKAEKNEKTQSVRITPRGTSPRTPGETKPRGLKTGKKDPFDNNPDLLKSFLKAHPRGDSLESILYDLIRNYYKISNSVLNQKSNIPENTIKDLVNVNNAGKSHDLKNIYAIAITLNIPYNILSIMLESLGKNPNPIIEPDYTYMCLYSVSKNMTQNEINEYCTNHNIPKIFNEDKMKKNMELND